MCPRDARRESIPLPHFAPSRSLTGSVQKSFGLWLEAETFHVPYSPRSIAVQSIAAVAKRCNGVVKMASPKLIAKESAMNQSCLDVAGLDGAPEDLWEDGDRRFYKIWRESTGGMRHAYLAVLPATDPPTRGSLRRLEHEYEDRKSTRLNSSHLGISYA